MGPWASLDFAYNQEREAQKTRRTEHRQNPDPKIIKHAELLHVALLELLLWQRQELYVARDLGGVHDRNARGYALETESREVARLE